MECNCNFQFHFYQTLCPYLNCDKRCRAAHRSKRSATTPPAPFSETWDQVHPTLNEVYDHRGRTDQNYEQINETSGELHFSGERFDIAHELEQERLEEQNDAKCRLVKVNQDEQHKLIQAPAHAYFSSRDLDLSQSLLPSVLEEMELFQFPFK